MLMFHTQTSFALLLQCKKSTINHFIHRNALTCSRGKPEVRKPDLNQKLVRKYWKRIQLKNVRALQCIHTRPKHYSGELANTPPWDGFGCVEREIGVGWLFFQARKSSYSVKLQLTELGCFWKWGKNVLFYLASESQCSLLGSTKPSSCTYHSWEHHS